ncbi:MAG: 4'-phosphopantetheinyl transferase superfamily protein [Ferruginibacter sp.]
MVQIFYYRCNERMPPAVFQHYLAQVPPFTQKKIQSFKHWQDAERSLAGNILLLKGLKEMNITGIELARLQYNAFQKPYFDNQVQFNISHSGLYTICAISCTNAVGIDVEEIKEIPLGDFTEFFYYEEWQEVLNAVDPTRAFYTLWTKKESFLKVIGTGLNVPLNKIIIRNEQISWENKNWLLQPVLLDELHVCHLCTNIPKPSFTVEAVQLF